VLGKLGSVSLASLLPRLISAWTSGNRSVAALLDDYVAEGKISGAVAVIGTHAGPRFICAGHIALGERAPGCGPDSLWRIYSMSKLVTGAAAMQLLEDGKLALDMPVAEIFPAFGSSQVLIETGKPDTHRARSPVTIRHLMTHTSGLVTGNVTEEPLAGFYRNQRLDVRS
jgi:CubicO group peptidase (beta-lactamase class C family)